MWSSPECALIMTREMSKDRLINELQEALAREVMTNIELGEKLEKYEKLHDKMKDIENNKGAFDK